MRLARIDQALEDCDRHLSSTGTHGTEIENLLTRSLLVLICAEFEQQIDTIIEERCSSINDKSLEEFFASCVDAVFRSVKSSEIAGLLNRFGGSYKETFKQKADANPVAVTFYNNIVTNRHGAAHSDGGNVTFAEVKRFYEEGHVVLDYFRETLLSTRTP
jgi:RiboL-PSP-HEPN